MSSSASSPSARSWPSLEARRSSVAELQQSLRLAEREEFGVQVVEVVGAFDILDWANAVEGRDSAMLRAEVLSGNQLQIERAMQRRSMVNTAYARNSGRAAEGLAGSHALC